MIRRFKFEGDIYETLDFVPMSVRRKLDRAGIKVSLQQWKSLGRGERLAICHLPANLEEEREALVIFINEALERAKAGEAKILSAEEREVADPPDEAPQRLVERATAEGVTLNKEFWQKLDSDERYALMKLGGEAKVGHNFTAALREMVETHA